ncbi:MAG TPA: tRNA 2-selenouridine(34) synthase MnmH [Patescibacteria group bacterium]|nr:tRNA 2-selenouridine(34) synthase MnmH [Patescibacteria group bacterium]
MDNTVTVDDLLKMDKPYLVDVRSPGEFQAGHICGAINVPLFSDEERSQVGILYKTDGGEAAKTLGLSLVGPKLSSMVETVQALHKTGRPVVVYCWRGGMRSLSIVNVLRMMGVAALQLLGGYKAHRRYVLEALQNFVVRPRIVMLCGSTGTGKTTLLKLLEKREIPVLDLEQLANHRGSAFGQVGLGQGTTAQNFDAQLLVALQHLDQYPYFVVECESKRIGNVYLPDTLYQAMKTGEKILLSADREVRVDRLIEEYGVPTEPQQAMILECIRSLRKRLGQNKTEQLSQSLQQGNIREVVRTLLQDYYDPLYGYETADPTSFHCALTADSLDEAVLAIVQYLETGGRNCGANGRRNLTK